MNLNNNLTSQQVKEMDYVSFVGLLNETNRPPGGKDSIRRMVQNSFIDRESYVLHSGCNTGYCSFEIAHLTKCKIVGIDLNEKMIASAQSKLQQEIIEYKDRISFKTGDAQKLEFDDNTFDLVMSGGSTAFIKDKQKAISEYLRVCKPYGFVADTCLFYVSTPPKRLLDEINEKIKINIQPWDEKYWIDLYGNSGLEIYYVHSSKMKSDPSEQEVMEYCKKMIINSAFTKDLHETAILKLYDYMILFNENHKYLGYNVLVCRKTPKNEQVALFGY